MKITFISPYYPNIWEPLGIAYITSYLKKHYNGYLDLKFFHGNFDSEEMMIKTGSNSDVVTISCTTPTFKNGYEIAKKIKALNQIVKIVMGGWHPTTAKVWVDDVIDHVVYGEGEREFSSIINDDLWKGKPACYNSPPISFLELPWPDRDFIRQDRTLKLCKDICGEKIASFQSRRGCPMNCKICAEHCMSGKGVRVRDTNDLLEEIKSVYIKYEFDRFKFVDPTWGYPKSAVIDFCEKKNNIVPNLPWESMCHASFLDYNLLRLMKWADCKQINIGCESGSQKILNSMNKGVTIEKIKKVFKLGRGLGIEMRAFFILGLPDETLETIEETRQLAREIKADHFGMTILCPYPGSYYYDVKKYKDVDWSKADEYSNNFWKTDNFTNQQLKDIQKSFYDEFKDNIVWHQKLITERNNE